MKLGVVGLPNVGKSTLFNAINVILAAFVLLTGSYKNMLFMIVIVCNVVIGIVQERKAQSSLEALRSLSAPTARVVRGGAEEILPARDLVLGDVVLLDEPTSGLDFVNMVRLASLVRRFASEGRAVVVVSHDAEFLSRACDRVVRFE